MMDEFILIFSVNRVHSETNIFRYDENILFTKRELAPVIDSYRDVSALHP